MTLPIFKSKEIGLQLLQSKLVSLFKIGTAFATLYVSGKILASKDLFINFVSQLSIDFFRKIVGILLGPVLLLPIKVMMISFTSSAMIG